MKKLVYGALFLALIGTTLTFTSCEKSEKVNDDIFNESFSNKSTLDTFDYQLINGVSSNTEISKIILNHYKNKFNSDVNYPDEIHNLLDNSVEENFKITIENGSLNNDDLLQLRDFCEKISYSNTKNAAQTELNKFKESDYYSTLSNSKKLVIDNSIALVYHFGLDDNHNDSDDFIEFEISSECAWAIAAFAAASLGLVTLTATTGGLATLAVIASYNVACIQLVQACKK